MLSFKSLLVLGAVALSSAPSLVDFVDSCYCAIGYQASPFAPSASSAPGGNGWASSADNSWKSPATYLSSSPAANTLNNYPTSSSPAMGLVWDTSSSNSFGNKYTIDSQMSQVSISSLGYPSTVTQAMGSLTNTFSLTGKLANCVIPAGSSRYSTSLQFQPYAYIETGNTLSQNHQDNVQVFTQQGTLAPVQVQTNKYIPANGEDIFYTNQFQLPAGANTIYIVVLNTDVQQSAAGGCPYIYKYTVTCTATGGAHGDPQFTGFLNQDYQIHGSSNTVYNILSTPTLQYNALFSFLEHGECREGTLCFSHPGNYFGAIGAMIHDAEKNENANILVEAGGVKEGMKVSINKIELTPSEHKLSFGEYTLYYPNQFELYMDSNEFNFKLSNSDHFINQDVSIGSGLLSQIAQHKQIKRVNATAAVELESTLPHGLLGQTWQLKKHANRWKFIEGHLFDYQMDDGILGKEFKYNRFQY